MLPRTPMYIYCHINKLCAVVEFRFNGNCKTSFVYTPLYSFKQLLVNIKPIYVSMMRGHNNNIIHRGFSNENLFYIVIIMFNYNLYMGTIRSTIIN